MSEDHIWLENLGLSLRANRQLAYLYSYNEDKFQFMGDVLGILGCENEFTPVSKSDFIELIHPDDLVSRQISIADMVAKADDKQKTYSLSYRLKRSSETTLPIIETGVISKSGAKQDVVIQGLMSIDVETIERQKKLSKKMGFREAVSSSFSAGQERRNLIDRIDEILEDQDRSVSNGYLLLVEVDRVSFINQVYGHSKEVLKEIKEKNEL